MSVYFTEFFTDNHLIFSSSMVIILLKYLLIQKDVFDILLTLNFSSFIFSSFLLNLYLNRSYAIFPNSSAIAKRTSSSSFFIRSKFVKVNNFMALND